MSNNSPQLSFTGRIRSVRCAMHGLACMLRSQQNAWVHAFASGVVVAIGFVLQLTRFEWCWIVLATVSVWTAEALNTAVEFLTDVAAPQFHPLAGKAKDVAAAAVLVAAFGAVVIGLLIIGPHLWASARPGSSQFGPAPTGCEPTPILVTISHQPTVSIVSAFV